MGAVVGFIMLSRMNIASRSVTSLFSKLFRIAEGSHESKDSASLRRKLFLKLEGLFWKGIDLELWVDPNLGFKFMQDCFSKKKCKIM
jgi:hypothetical protein